MALPGPHQKSKNSAPGPARDPAHGPMDPGAHGPKGPLAWALGPMPLGPWALPHGPLGRRQFPAETSNNGQNSIC